MTLVLNGKNARDFYKKFLLKRVRRLSDAPELSIIQIGDNKESSIYIEQKKKFAAALGIKVSHTRMPAGVSFEEAASTVRKENEKDNVTGIIIQLPLPPGLDSLGLINLIDPEKDVDGLTDENQRLLEAGIPRFVPATARGVILLLDFYKISVEGKNVTVLGRSRLVGHPIAEALKSRGAKVSVCHSKTPDTRDITKGADIIVVAIGRPEYLDHSYVKSGAIVIDVGINGLTGEKLEEEPPKRKVVGDVRYSDVFPKVSAISPVPGGVGPMTVLSLFDNLVSAAERKTLL